MKFVSDTKRTEWYESVLLFRETSEYDFSIMRWAQKWAETMEEMMNNNPNVKVADIALRAITKVHKDFSLWTRDSLTKAIGLLERMWLLGDQVRAPIEFALFFCA